MEAASVGTEKDFAAEINTFCRTNPTRAASELYSEHPDLIDARGRKSRSLWPISTAQPCGANMAAGSLPRYGFVSKDTELHSLLSTTESGLTDRPITASTRRSLRLLSALSSPAIPLSD
jgi:hypothetical protein